MLKTPLGNLAILKNGVAMKYQAIPQPLKVFDDGDYYVDARYLILVDTAIIQSGDKIECFLECSEVVTDTAGGEYLSLLNFRENNMLLSLGAFDVQVLDHGDDRPIAFETFYSEHGVEAYFADTQYVEQFRLAIAWVTLKEERDRDLDELATWYAANPLYATE